MDEGKNVKHPFFPQPIRLTMKRKKGTAFEPGSSDWRLATAVASDSRMKAGHQLHLSEKPSPVD